ncbi:putative legume-like lectin, concanavalin A-like lectin/glucanase domain superfamily [Septoria linicola]|nr:putative legume-like lectin, concanavalin A-like lectin/glucanase domain superfamily [Septoria linicola]
MAFLRIPQPLKWLVFATLASAVDRFAPPIDSLSFGHKGDMAPGQNLPGWHHSSVNHEVQVLRDRVILTPPVPGMAKGALWSDASIGEHSDWTAQLDFRASGQETGSGNIQVWYTQDGDTIGADSVYNAQKFDGLVIVVDQYGGSGGKIRGFLNDNSVNFRTSASLESLAFGHCDYSYRNLGRPSKLKITNRGGLTVTIDDKTCFSSDKIFLPAGNNYHFGITATTGENPDSFEATKFVVSTGGDPITGGQQGYPGNTAQQPIQGEQQQHHNAPHINKMDSMPGSPEMLPDRDADTIRSQTEQFADLHNRVQAISHHMGTLYHEIKAIADKIDAKHSEVVNRVQNIGGSRDTGLPPETVGKINALHDRVSSIESVVNIIRNDLEGKDYKQSMDELHTAMSFLHHNFHHGIDGKMEMAIKTHGPSTSQMIFTIIGFQLLMVLGYAFYKRKRHSQPKKYL